MSPRRLWVQVVLLAAVAGSSQAATTTVDFETPLLVSSEQQVINPYVASGVTFTAVPAFGVFNPVIGLVKNRSTSSCVEPRDENQKLATGPAGVVGFSAFPIKAAFPPEPAPPVTVVSVEFQCLAGTPIRLRLFNASNAEIASVTEEAQPPDGTCGNPGLPRARKVLTATSSERVAYAIMEDFFNPNVGGISVFVLDNFTFGDGAGNQPPLARCIDVIVPAGEGCRAEASINDGSYDPDGDSFTCTQSPLGPYSLGITPVTMTCTDSKGASSSCTANVTVVDETRPQLTVEVHPSILWPPNHRMVPVHVTLTTADACDPNPVVTLVSVTSDEPDEGLGDGDLPGDVNVLGPNDLELRSERQGGGDGRQYVLCYRSTDQAGNVSVACDTVRVPHDASGHAALANDGGEPNIVVFGSTRMQVRDIQQSALQVRTGDFATLTAWSQPRFEDRNSDGIEDAVYGIAAAESREAQDQLERARQPGIGLFARWDVAGVDYLADLLEPIVTGVESERLPERLTAFVRPNPARGAAEVHYELPMDAHVSLSVYDVSGREVGRLVDGFLPAGRHTARWAGGTRTGAQLYLFRLETMGHTISRRFVLL